MSNEMTSGDRLTTLFTETRELFETQIDTKWMYTIIDDLPIESSALDQVRRFLSDEASFFDDYQGTQAGLDLLERLISDLRINLLPVLREKLGISGFRDNFSFKNKDQYVVQHMVSYTFPHNLERLEGLVRELRLMSSGTLPDPTSLPDGIELPADQEKADEISDEVSEDAGETDESPVDNPEPEQEA